MGRSCAASIFSATRQRSSASLLGGHGGGDGRLMDAFIQAVAGRDQGKILSGAWETLESHWMVFAAEKARKENRVVNLVDEYWPRFID